MVEQDLSVELQEFSAISDIRKRQMLNALKAQLGIVSSAAVQTGINRDTHYYWMKHDPDYAKAVKMLGEQAIDFAESKLFELIKGVSIRVPNKDPNGPPTIVYTREPNVAACIFYLKTKAKHRGYVERLQLDDITDQDDLNTTLDV